MKAVIMAGGLGARLQPLTLNCPKPMVSFINKPVLEHILCLLKRHHIFEVVITVRYMSNQIQNYLGDGRRLGMTIHYAIEENPLGTAGGVKNAQPFLDDKPFLVISGDAITDIDLSHLLQFHQKKQALATLAMKQVPNPQGYGVVVSDDKGRITQFVEKPRHNPPSSLVNTGIYVLEPEVLTLMKPRQAYDFSLDIFPLLLEKKALFGCLTDGYWCDIGTIPSYLKATADALTGKVSHISLEWVGRQQAGGYNAIQNKSQEPLVITFIKNPKIFPCYWIILSLIVVIVDYSIGPFIQFPFLFVVPVIVAAWYNGWRWGGILAVSLSLTRLYFNTLWVVPWTLGDASINALIRMAVLLLVAYLVDRTAKQSRALAQEVQTLRGLLPICSFCKKIRADDNTWEPIERYISQRSEAQFSHGFCPECAKEHYPEYFRTLEIESLPIEQENSAPN